MTANEFKEELKKSGFDFFTGVPCSILGGLIKAMGSDYIPSVREDTAIGLASGAYLGGKTPCVLMQNSGLGYCLNVLSSLNIIYRIPVLLIVSYRGFKGEDAPEHIVMGKYCVELISLFGISARVCDKDNVREILAAAADEIKKGFPSCVFIREGILSL